MTQGLKKKKSWEDKTNLAYSNKAFYQPFLLEFRMDIVPNEEQMMRKQTTSYVLNASLSQRI